MTTAEFIFPQPADSLLDRRQELRKVLWAFLAALLIHIAAAVLLAGFGGAFTSAEPMEEQKPMEMTVVDLATPPPVKNTAFIETDESKQAPQPAEKTFESNANSVGASQLAASGDLPLPSQDGKERPWMDLETHQYSLRQKGDQPQPDSAAQETPQPSPPPQSTPEATPLTDGEQLAMLTSTPSPSVQPSVAPTPQRPGSAYRRQQQQTRIRGNISNRGISAVNALGTPLGRYQKIVVDAIGSRWYAAIGRQTDLFGIGTARLLFWIDREGQIRNLKVVENSSNELFVNVCIQSVQEAQLPPMSDDLAATLPPEGLQFDIPFIIYPN